MAYIRYLTKLPSGKDGLYIYADVNGSLFVDIPEGYYTKADVEQLSAIFQLALKEWDE